MTIEIEDFLMGFTVVVKKKANPKNIMCWVICIVANVQKWVRCCHTVFYVNLFAIVRCRASKVQRLTQCVTQCGTQCVTQCVTLVTLLSHWLQLCEEQSHVTGDGRALAPKRQKPRKTGNHAAAGDRNPTGELDRNQTEITEIHQKSFFHKSPPDSELGTPFNHGCFHKSIDYQFRDRKNKC